ncbi:unnamed protein product [Rhizoctonia solani]|uniref:Protein kinase domain-containing protein n=1 Tax=Rhizoctonia solani TaxID=456999 RepID=A0A8H2WY78_9AGAM|nr:unnamed protein product [Rhizoctonia solani]
MISISFFPELKNIYNVITSTMSRRRVVKALRLHGCEDLTGALEHSAHATIPVAQGGFGDVFRGRLHSGTLIAIKTLRLRESQVSIGGDRKRAARELYTWSKCEHPNVVKLMGLAVFNDTIAMVSRWEENGNLSRYLSLNPSADRWVLSTGISAGVAYIHDIGIVSVSSYRHSGCLLILAMKSQVHGDIKGTNVLVAQDGTPMLMDFGTAHLTGGDLEFQDNESDPGQATGSALHQEQSHVPSTMVSHAYNNISGAAGPANLIAPTLAFTQTKTGLNFSLRWAAPELLLGEVNRTTTATDVYALGMTILETFTSTVPFVEKKSDHTVIMEVAFHKRIPTRPQEVIPEGSVYGDQLWDILTKCWSYDPQDRPSAGDFWDQMNLITPKTPKESEIEPEESKIELEEGRRWHRSIHMLEEYWFGYWVDSYLLTKITLGLYWI